MLALSSHPKGTGGEPCLHGAGRSRTVGKVQDSREGGLCVLSGFIYLSVTLLVQTLVRAHVWEQLVSPSAYIWRAGLGQLSVELLVCISVRLFSFDCTCFIHFRFLLVSTYLEACNTSFCC